jgi:hypothetical protein
MAELLQLLGVQDAAHYTSAASQPAVASQPDPQGLPASTLSGLLSDLLCPITQEPMRDPVVAADGRTYERTAIEGEWMHGCRCLECNAADAADILLRGWMHQCTSQTDCPRCCLAGWFARQAAAGQAPCSPLTNLPLEDVSLRPNMTVSSLVRAWQAAGLLE